jgi:predicted RNA-binding protein with PIN domain
MLIVDGYNVLMQMGLKDKTLEARRDHFIRILNTRSRMFDGIMVVFDGKEEVEGSYIKPRIPVRVIYTRGESADDRIKLMIEKAQNPRAITIATDDREIKDFAKMHGCKLISSQELIEKLIPRQEEKPEVEENKDTFLNSDKARAITEELKKKWN